MDGNPAMESGEILMESRASSGEFTMLLGAAQSGDEAAREALLPLIYEELRRLAGAYMRGERDGHTLQPTALVHEAWMRLTGVDVEAAGDRSGFLRVAARAMRQVLVDHARAVRSGKRGGTAQRVRIDDALVSFTDRAVDLIGLDEAMERLAQQDERKTKVVELRFFGGLTVEETAEVLEIPVRTVERDWTMARAWLKKELEGG